MSSTSPVQRIADQAARPDPYPVYAELRRSPVIRDESGVHLVTTYWEIHDLLQDSRISSDARNLAPGANPLLGEEDEATLPPSFIRLDPPEHDRLRRLAMRPFGPPHSPRRIHDMHGELTAIVTDLLDGLAGRERFDVVDDFAYPLPVAVICRLLGVPAEDEPRFRVMVDGVVAGLNPAQPVEERRAAQHSRFQLGQYLAELIEEHRRHPGEDMLSAWVTDEGPEGRMSLVEMVTNAVLLLIAGHETTVNLIANGMLTLLRHPDQLRRLRENPSTAPRLVEELLRYEPPVQFLPQRTTLTDLDVAGTVIPKGAPVWLLLASGNRDPRRFTDADIFDPAREDNQHLGFGFGIHACFGAPLARLETQVALTELVGRLADPQLPEDPPPYRPSPVLRGPRHLEITGRLVA
ncbi:Cytochrome P450 [Saccharopolyspora kobensis]|uniref:Cytochrome P450 n=1 Tax=Saccharopolyspora kobensis TaxID=146035 RepID=A0A1H5T6J9_9PSEU|nr:cytochrome P450 [Saccharopolyspora kobensis]SEF58410.1 Cytochrome P450 [Saccharopolyspora kobensis]SFC49545.1 Cytochrome P450 [Saccharopolyspora kobensis]